MNCDCFFCRTNKPHPDDRGFHAVWTEISSRLKVAESLRPEDIVRYEACDTCGHKRVKES